MTAPRSSRVRRREFRRAVILHPLDHAPPEEAVRRRKEHEENDQERERVLVGGADVSGAERLEEPEQQAARDRSQWTAHPAEHRRRKAFQREERSYVVARQRDRRDQDTRDGADRRRASEGERHDERGIDSDESRR